MARKNIERLILNHERRLQKLKERQALLGLTTPPDILIEIEDIEAAIKELQIELTTLEGRSNEKPLISLSVQIYLQGNFSSLSTERQSAAIDAFAAVMGISPQAIEVRRVYEGSIVFDLGIPPDAVEHLRSRLQSNSVQLRLLKVERVILERQLGEIEEWAIEEEKFHLAFPTNSPLPPLGYSLKDIFITYAKRLVVFCRVVFQSFIRAESSLKAWIKIKARTKILTEALGEAEARAKALTEARAETKIRTEAKALAKALVKVLQAEAWFLDTVMANAITKAKAQAETVTLTLTKVETLAEAWTETRSQAEVKALAEARVLAKVLAEVEAQAKSKVISEDKAQVKKLDEALTKTTALAEALAEAIAQLRST